MNPPNFKPGACAACHSGPMLNQTNQFLPVAVPPGTRFQIVLVSEFNAAGNPVMNFVFRNQQHDLAATNQDGTPDGIIEVTSPDPGRALITGRADDFGSFDHLNAFKISPLRGIGRRRRTSTTTRRRRSTTWPSTTGVLPDRRDPDGPGPGAADGADRSGQAGHGGLHEAAEVTVRSNHREVTPEDADE